MVYANISRGGPGVGSIQPAQMDYFQATKASGNGGFQMMVFAPSTVQEAVDMTYAAFDYADRDRNPVLILADGVIGTMMEPVVLPEMKSDEEVAALKASKQDWACVGHKLDYAHRAWIQPGHWLTSDMQKANEDAAALYASWEKDVQVEEYRLEDAEVVLTAYGISARICKSAVELLRAQGVKAGLIRPITVHPFPYAAYDHIDYSQVKAVLDVEMSIPAQLRGRRGGGCERPLPHRDVPVLRRQHHEPRQGPCRGQEDHGGQVRWQKYIGRTKTIQEDKVSGFCPGCMHGTVIKLIGEVLEEMDLVDRAACVLGIGCCGLHMDYIAYDNTTAPHGRACAVATGMKRSNPGQPGLHLPGRRRLGLHRRWPSPLSSRQPG